METPLQTMHFVVSGNPISKARPRLGRGGHVFTPKTTQNYEKLVALAFRSKLAATPEDLEGGGPWPLAASYRVHVVAYMENKRRVDLDNIFKSIGDGLNGVAYYDDCLIDEFSIIRGYDKHNPRAEITIDVMAEVDDKTYESFRTAHEKKMATKPRRKKRK